MLAQVLGNEYATRYGARRLSPEAFHAVERASFAYTHVEAIEILAGQWRLPPEIAQPMARHHVPVEVNGTPSAALAAIGHFVGSLQFAEESLIVSSDRRLREYGAAALGLDERTWEQVCQGAVEEYNRLASLYGKVLPEDVDVVEVLNQANRHLADLATQTDLKLLDLSSERQRLQHSQRQLAQALRDYRERAALDPLTRVFNRGGLTDAVRRAVVANREQGTPLGLLFIDIDDFKRINDSCGHKVGDEVLKAVAARLCEGSEHEATVGRYGGEEFVVLLRGVDPEGVRRVAARLVEAVRSIPARALGADGPLSVSVGAVWTGPGQVVSAEELVAAADELMYRAKRHGKDRFFFSAKPPSEAATIQAAGSSCTDDRDGVDASPEMESLERLRTLAERLNLEAPDTGSEVRKEQRVPFVAPAILHCLLPDGSVRVEPACLRNISAGGAGVIALRPMVRGDHLELELCANGKRLTAPGMVAFCRHLQDSVHELGIQFSMPSIVPVAREEAVEVCAGADG